MPAENTCRIVAGRLIEIDVANGYQQVADIDEMIAKIRAVVASVPEPKPLVIAADWRNCRLFSEPVAERAVAMLTRTAHRIERSAILHRLDHATSVLQVFRLVKEANQPHRQLFTDARQLEQWLGEVLDEAERARLHTFLAARA